MVIMVFFKAELELLRIDSANIFGTQKKPVTEEIAKNRIKNCHRRHMELCKFASLLDTCLSPIHFIYISVYAGIICVDVYQYTMTKSMLLRCISTLFLLIIVIQLFVYCWHCNDVLFASRQLMLGPYESMWWASNLKFRKDVFILTAQYRKEIVFSAGPFANMTLETFINIMKAAYSYYTLLNQTQT